MPDNLPHQTIETLYKEVKQVIEESRSTAYRAVNFAMVQAYWNIGKLIIEEEQKGEERAGYGEALLDGLSKKLTKEYGKGFSNRNLRHIRQFYRTFPKWNAVRSKLSWTHYRFLLSVENEKARQFYLQEAIDCNWSTRSLERQINNLYYQRMVLSKNDEGVKEEATQKTQEQATSDIIPLRSICLLSNSQTQS